MRNNIIILKHFANNKDKQFTIKKVSEILRMNYRIAYEGIMNLEKKGLITLNKIGNSNVCAFRYSYTSTMIEVEELRKKEVFGNKDILLLSKRISEVKSPFYSLVLFGSHATGKASRHSDIDLCLLADNHEINKEVNAILSVTPLDIHLQEFTTKDFLALLRSRENNVGNEIVRNNVVLHGMEAFYELVSRVKQAEG
ncbi:MAG TPA: nucleotidyltransferase domain-containing protein [Candidatus Nanoarchaeia archaeon]|nr:nucleotidyltransferase domain-containing protein [Candidatus Nanoarchaeia archaeon]